jgi:tetratricopeptide (TPR) repeat protein
MGVVYIVYDHDHRVPYAIKTPHDRHLLNPVARERFIREAEVWVKLGRHQNIVRAICVDQTDNQPYIVLEYVIGSNLRQSLAKGRLLERTALSYAIQFCRGMAHAQEKIPNFVHLDIKPENCMLTENDILKVTDFSLSKALVESDPVVEDGPPPRLAVPEGREKRAGTFPYMSPEQFLDFGRVGMKSDIYSFGVLLYEMLTGKRPFSAKTDRQWKEIHLREKPLNLQTMVPSVSRELEDLTLRCLAKDPRDRPENFLVLRDRFEAMFQEEFREDIPLPTPAELEGWEYSNIGVSLCNLGHVDEAIPYFDKAFSINPQNPRVWLNKGVAFGKLRCTAEELECYAEALAIAPDYAEVWYNKGLALYTLGRFEEALGCYDRCLAINPHQAEVWVNKGLALGNLGFYEKELSCYDKALAVKPNHARAWVNKASALIHWGSFGEADVCCDKALAIRPGMAEAWANKASALGALKRFDEAIRCCEKALAINPHLCEAWVCKGLALGSLERPEEERSCYEEALHHNPDHFEAWYRKGLNLSKVGRFEEAVGCYDSALAINPQDADAWVKKGLALMGMACVEAALICYDKALTIHARHAEAWLNKGLTLRKLGSRAEADHCIQTAIGLDRSLSQTIL